MNFFTKLILATVIMLSDNLAAQNLADLLPSVPPGWQLNREDKIYDTQTLYDYIDGGAELYLSYGMKEVISRIITKGEYEIRIEIFDMIEARNAFGVFTNTRLEDEQQYGQGSQYFTGAQIFWKGKYYIAITANDENESIINAIKRIATSIDEHIKEKGEIPDIIGLLPQEELQSDGFLYFYHYIWLNSYYYIADDNFLNVDATSPAVLAKYNDKENRIYMLLIQYPDKSIAGKALHAFKQKFIIDANETFAQIEDGTWLGGELEDNLLICIFSAKTQTEATNLLTRTINQYKSKQP